ncbi:MAG: hypothetical protein NDI61_08120 [Bdellovibrionaceae bacterium]|nr:hypothetical protein [Pseudobdellovibrionaceae bacterium]
MKSVERLTSRFAFALVFLCVSLLAVGPTEARVGEDSIANVFSYVYNNEALRAGQNANYVAYYCPTNVHRLLVRLQEAGVDLAGSEVYYLMGDEDATYWAGYKYVFPLQARAAADDGWAGAWTFHVILRIDDQILDLDFTTEPRIAPVDAYFDEMWGLGPKAVSRVNLPSPMRNALWIRAIPAEAYLRDYDGIQPADGRNDYRFYLQDPTQVFPAQLVEEKMGWQREVPEF